MSYHHNHNLDRAVARSKSYVGIAFLVLFLYSLGWLPGFIANWLYLREVRKMEGLAGESLTGTGCLVIMFWLNIVGVTVTGLVLATIFIVLPLLGLVLAMLGS